MFWLTWYACNNDIPHNNYDNIQMCRCGRGFRPIFRMKRARIVGRCLILLRRQNQELAGQEMITLSCLHVLCIFIHCGSTEPTVSTISEVTRKKNPPAKRRERNILRLTQIIFSCNFSVYLDDNSFFTELLTWSLEIHTPPKLKGYSSLCRSYPQREIYCSFRKYISCHEFNLMSFVTKSCH